MTDTEKKIAEIRKALEKAYCNVPEWMPNTTKSEDLGFPVNWFIEKDNKLLLENAPYWIEKLLQDRKALQEEYAEERAAHNAHVTELCELEEEMRKLREERDAYYNNARYTEAAFHEVTSLRSQLQSAQQEIERLRAEIAGMFNMSVFAFEQRNQMIAQNSNMLKKIKELIGDLTWDEFVRELHENQQEFKRVQDLLAERDAEIERLRAVMEG